MSMMTREEQAGFNKHAAVVLIPKHATKVSRLGDTLDEADALLERLAVTESTAVCQAFGDRCPLCDARAYLARRKGE